MQALSEISNGESDSIVNDIESFDFGTSDKDELIRNIQQQIREVKEDLQFHRNLKGKNLFFVHRNKVFQLKFSKTKSIFFLFRKYIIRVESLESRNEKCL